MPSFLFELSGEHPTMCTAEAIRCMEAETDSFEIVGRGPGYVIGSFDGRYLDPIADRISLTHSLGHYLGSFDPDDLSGLDSIEIPEGTFSVRGKRFEGMMKDIDSQDIVRKLGGILSKRNDVDLEDPKNRVRILMSDRLHIFLAERTVDRNILETRKVGERPFFSPISLHPRYARALINLTGVKKGGTVLDPFCGTGGIVIEAGFMGMRAIASDFDPEMIAGTQENMDFYGLEMHDFDVCDIGEIAERFPDMDSVCTDPPYGRSTKTGGEKIDEIYRRAGEVIPRCVKKGHKAGMVLPHPLQIEGMELQNMFLQRVHGTLTRHYHIFQN